MAKKRRRIQGSQGRHSCAPSHNNERHDLVSLSGTELWTCVLSRVQGREAHTAAYGEAGGS